jgi:hypothetical protein
MSKGQIHSGVAFVSDKKATVVAKPGDGTFDLPATPVAAKRATVLQREPFSIPPVGADQLDPSLAQPHTKRVTVGRLVVDQFFHLPIHALWPRHLIESLFNQPDLRRGRRGKQNSQRNTLAVCHHHKLRTLSAFCLSDARAPFLAAMNVPSPNVSSQTSLPRPSSSPRNVRQISSHTSSSSQRFSRLQQVLGLGQCSGIISHWAPDLSTHRIPSKHSRSDRQGRPPFAPFGNCGKCGPILSHIASVTNCFFRAIGCIPPAPTYSPMFLKSLAIIVPTETLFDGRSAARSGL